MLRMFIKPTCRILANYSQCFNKNLSNASYNTEDFIIKKSDPAKFDQYMEFMVKHFIQNEPVTKGLRVPSQDAEKLIENQVKIWLESGPSVKAIHKPTNELAGINFTKILTRDKKEVFTNEDLTQYTESAQNLLKVLFHLEGSVNLFEDPKINKILELATITVDPKFSGHGLVYLISEECEKMAIEQGCQIAISQATNVITQHVRKKMGYKVIYTLDLATFEIDGKRLIDLSLMDGTTVAQVVMKRLIN